MRIAIDIRPLLEPRPGGVAHFTSCILDALLRKPSHQYALFSNAVAREPKVAGEADRRFSRYPNKLLNASFAFLGTPTIEGLSGGADAVYLPNLNFAATRLPYVVTVHDLSFVRYPRFFSAKQRLWHGLVEPRRLIEGAAAVTAVSEHTKADLMETYGIAGEKITVVSPGVDRSFRPLPPAECAGVLKKYDLRPGYFLFLGTIEPRKNIKNIIAAFERLGGNARLVIAGGDGWLCRAIHERAARSPARDRIRFIGYVVGEEKPALYSAALAFIYPSFYEGFGMPPLEAMACGVPVIASHVTSLGEVVGDAGLLVDPYNTNEIVAAMTALRDEPGLRETMRLRGLAQAKKFSWEGSAARLESVFASLRKS